MHDKEVILFCHHLPALQVFKIWVNRLENKYSFTQVVTCNVTICIYY